MTVTSAGLTRTRPVPAGSHECWVVDDPAGLAARAASLLAGASRARQRPAVLAPAGSPVLAALPPGETAARPFRDYLAGGRPDAAAVAAAIREQAGAALASGYAGIQLVADMDWLLPARPSPGAITAYETMIDRVTAEAGASVACAYRRSSFPRDALDGALAVHPVIRGRHASPQFRFTCSGPGQWRLSGDIDISVTGVFAAGFRAAVRPGGGTVDLSGLEFADLSGIRAIADAAADAGGPVELRGAPLPFRRYWQLCDLGRTAPGIRLTR